MATSFASSVGGKSSAPVPSLAVSSLPAYLKDLALSVALVDFDMTAVGPAGSELGFLALMLFRCGFAPELVLPRAVQRQFAGVQPTHPPAFPMLKHVTDR